MGRTDGEIQFSEIKSVEGVRDEDLISLYPNPSTGQVFLEWPSLKKDTQVNLNVFDVFGQSVWTGRIQLQAGGQNRLHFDRLANGLFQLQIELDGNFYSIPFIMMDR